MFLFKSVAVGESFYDPHFGDMFIKTSETTAVLATERYAGKEEIPRTYRLDETVDDVP